MGQSIGILYLEDDAVDVELAKATLEAAGIDCRVTCVQTAHEFREALCLGGYDVILADYRLPAYDGISALRLAQDIAGDVPFIFVSGTMGESVAVDAMREGATDYVLKHRLKRLGPAVERALHEAENLRERRRAEAEVVNLSRRMELILNSAGQGIFGLDTDGNVTFANPAMARMLGGEVNELLGRRAHDLWHHTTPDGSPYPFEECPVNLALRNGRSFHTDDVEYWRRDGTSFLAEFTGEPIIEGGEVVGFVAVIEDVTERRRAEQSLRRSEWIKTILNRILAVFLAVPDEEVYGGVLSVVLDVMESRFGVCGYIGDNGDLVLPSLTRNVWDECQVHDKSIAFPRDGWGESVWGRAIREKRAFVSHGPFRTPEGHIHIDAFLTAPIVYGDETIGLISVANKNAGYTAEDLNLLENIANNISPILNARLQRDREERRRREAEEALRKNEAKLRSVLRVAPTGIVVATNRLIQEVNDRFCFMTGYSRDELVNGSGRLLYTTEEQYQWVGEEESRQISERGAAAMETQWRRKDGTLINVFFSSAPLDPGDLSAGFIYTALDITERERAGQELKESLRREQFLADIIRNASIGIKIAHPNGAIVPLNTAMIDITGYTAEELETTDWGNMITPPEWREHERAKLAQLERTGKPVTYEKEYIRKDGSRVPVQLTVHGIFDADGKVERHLAFVTDITSHKAAEDERRRFEANMRQAQKMEAIGTLAGGIAHDFNNILAAIVGYAEIALVKNNGVAPLSSYLEQILKGAARAANLVKQILTFSRQTEEEYKPIVIGPIIKEALKLLRASLPATIQIRQKISASPRRKVMGDPTRVHQVVMNLCTNAAYAMRERGGTLNVELTEVDLNDGDLAFLLSLQPGSYLCLKVGDTGHGMDQETMGRIFDPFFTTKPRHEGTGMGLAVVHGIVESCGGAITVQSKPGEGTQFYIYFPETASDVPEYRLDLQETPSGRGCILFVDDEYPLAESGRMILEGLGYNVVAKTSSLEALEVFRSGPDQFDLVITDLTMPHMTGVDLAKQMWRIRPDTPIILSTGYNEFVDLKSAADLGFRELVRKPMPRHVLAQAIRRNLVKS